MSPKRKNAGEGYGYMFSGAFSKKADAVKKERQRKGSFIKGMPTQKGYRYVVMTPRDNPRRRRAKNPRQNAGMHLKYFPVNAAWAYVFGDDIRTAQITKMGDWGPFFDSRKDAIWAARAQGLSVSSSGKVTSKSGSNPLPNPMDLTVMAANPSARECIEEWGGRRPRVHHRGNPQEIVVRPGQTITLRVNPLEVNPPAAADLCGAMIGGYPCTRKKGHRGPHLPQGATLRPQSRHNWGPRANPTAEKIREGFIGAPVDRISSYQEHGMPGGNYALLGKLLCLYVKPLEGGQVLEIHGRAVLVVSDESARQIFFVGGDQDISAALAAFGPRDLGAGRYELGEARRIDYKQRKEHAPDPEHDEWRHHFGEENGILPKVIFDSNLKRLSLEGGDYRIENRGIVN